MILKIREWCEGIIVAVILCIIIEALIPNGNNKKYIKVVIGVYIMYVTLSPILNLLEYELNLDNLFAINNGVYEEVSNDFDEEIKEVYIIGIEEDIKNEINQLGYEVENVKVFVDINYENVEKIELKLKTKNSPKNTIVEPIVINNENEKIQNDEHDIIKNYISENYLVETEKIVFK